MTTTIAQAPATLAPQASSVRDYFTLLKPGVMSLVVFTGITGMLMAPGTLHPMLQFVTILCIALGSGAGGAINMWYDRDIDAQMLRTSTRPVPAGRIAPADALAFGVILAVFSVTILGLAVNVLSAFVLAFAIAFYVGIYTVWLKRRTPQNIVIGGAAGAFPPVIGWAAVTGNIGVESLLLFAIIFFWTPPHFWALALYRNSDYARVGVPMLPVVAGKLATKKQMLGYTLLLLALTLVPCFIGMSGWVYAAGAVMLSGRFVWHALSVLRVDDDAPARAMFKFSILYLFALFAIMLIDRLLFLPGM